MPRVLVIGLRVWVVLGLLAPAAVALAQQPVAVPRPPALSLKVNVFQPLVRGYHLEIEKSWRRHPRHSLGLTLQGYRGHVTELSSRHEIQPGERVRGYGAELLHRFYFPGAHPEQLMGFYLAAGPHVQRFKLNFQIERFQPELGTDGLTYYRSVLFPYTETISRSGAVVLAGYQGPLDLGPLVLDFYVGLGWRQSNFRSAFPDSRYRSSVLDYGARGFYLPLGFKLGLAL
jgi:hypothetical protein